MKKSICCSLTLLLFFVLSGFRVLKAEDAIDLAGKWSFQLDDSNVGVGQKWFNWPLDDSIQLPGNTDLAKKGPINTTAESGRLTRLYPYCGAAWYARQIDIPADWGGREVFLFLELTKASMVWIDGHPLGCQRSLAVPHVYKLTGFVTPGSRHSLVIRIDNSDNPPVGSPHQISDDTQTNWNGILGRIELQAKARVHMERVRIHPDIRNRQIRVEIRFNRETHGTVALSASSWNSDVVHVVPPVEHEIRTDESGNASVILKMGEKMLLWDEFHPALYKLKIGFSAIHDGRHVADRREINFGMRDFGVKGTQFAINGKTIFLRGKQEAHVFPLTGHVPMRVSEWVRIFRIARSYGINHYRYHTCVPPAAAFEAADMVGIYMEPQMLRWGNVGQADGNLTLGDVEVREDGSKQAELLNYMMDESRGVLDVFGNHPSFCMFSLGNELHGSRALMSEMVNSLRAYDGRPLYASGSNNFLWKPCLSASDDYWTTTMTGGSYRAGYYHPDTKGKEVRSSYPVHTVGQINNEYPSTVDDYSKGIKGVPVPVISHESGQFQTYPNFKEIKKFTGVLRARNYEIFRDRLDAAGMLDQADDFFRASGKLAVLCYREEIETAIRTKGFGGFQMLDLQDFPGQGTALVGILDVFMDSKGHVTPEEWRQFCAPVVPLLRMDKYTWTRREEFAARMQLVNYGADDIASELRWRVSDADGELIESGVIPVAAPQGEISELGNINFVLPGWGQPAKLQITMELADGSAKNSYPLWVYPDAGTPETPDGITVAETLDPVTLRLLEAGGKVLLMPEPEAIKMSIGGAFQSDFWCYPMFKKYSPPGTLGILANPEHPVFGSFPTEYHSNWQWWPMVKHGRPIILDDLPEDFRPLVQVIDNFERNHKLGLIFECRLGDGRLLVSSCNLRNLQQYPEARQLLRSMFSYMEGGNFDPKFTLSVEDLLKRLPSGR